ncbi:shikimate kinase [Planobacterium oryzisoli]|uniref:Shikimate kinase n=1 Tax=Planobacterium oryzisoli TaxID=2771435 RepID=A0A930YVD3_9FLAO|nr:shikimate kinase [Planobacterium oryzisoli]MBF5027074.1 dephospho-CoA kinase [Planobacterium oryzisoli]
MVVSLVGYMGSGKSHISKLLSNRLGIPALDLDEIIAQSTGYSTTQYFEKFGELSFRKQERAVLLETLQSKEDLVLSLGGGTPVYYDNMDQILKFSTCIYLRAAVGTLNSRLLSERSSRPLLARIPEQDLAEFIAKHLFERSPTYSRAHHTVSTDLQTPEQTTEQILSLVDLVPR